MSRPDEGSQVDRDDVENRIDPADVASAAAAWAWMPPGGVEVRTDEFHFMRFPEWFGHQQVVGFWPDRDPEVVAAEVLDHARATGLPEVEWWVPPGAPAGVVELVTGLGGELSITLDVLALDLTSGAPDPGATPVGVDVRMATDREDLRTWHDVAGRVFDEPAPPDDELVVDPDRLGWQCIAYADGEPAGVGGLTLVDGVARLWSGAVLESHRRRGIYRALLHHRLGFAAGRGARMALVRGKVDTSAPILRAAGFAAYGELRGYRIRLSD